MKMFYILWMLLILNVLVTGFLGKWLDETNRVTHPSAFWALGITSATVIALIAMTLR